MMSMNVFTSKMYVKRKYIYIYICIYLLLETNIAPYNDGVKVKPPCGIAYL